MKDKILTDILLICKGWYNKTLYHNTLEAFNAYYHKYYGCEDIAMDKAFAEYLRSNGITCIANDCYTKDLNGKTLSLTAYAETKAQSSIISAYTKANPNIFKRVVKK